MLLLTWLACSSTNPADSGDSGDSGDLDPLEASVEDFSFPSPAGIEMEGLLHLPARFQGDPVPGVVLVHGSGPNSRHGTVSGQLNMGFGFEIEVYTQLAEALADSGLAVLRYDKRSCYSANGCDNDYPTPSADLLVQDFADDADAALTALGEHDEVDAERLVVVGHSQGASFVPALLVERPELAGGVLLAGEYQPIDAILQYQLDFTKELLAELGYTTIQIAEATADFEATMEALAAIRAGTHDGSDVWGVSQAFWEDWFAITDDAPLLAQEVEQPMLAVSGDYDWNIPPSETEAWAALFDTLAPSHQAEVVPCVTHALNCIGEPDWQQIGTADIGTGIDPGLVEVITDYLGVL